MARRDLDANVRSGLLTQPGVLAAHASVIQRGRFVRERVFCQELPDPPADVPKPDPKLDARARAEAHASQPSCKACHELMDPIGFGFLAYDGIGRYRPQAGNTAANTSGRLIGTDADGDFRSPVELARRIAGSTTVAGCFVKQWFRHATGRAEGAGDERSVAQLNGAFATHDIRELAAAVAASDAFQYYRALPGEENAP
jgi:hypothetical protein